MAFVKHAIKYILAPVIYRQPPFGLEPARLGVYLWYLLERTSVCGDVAEIGCHLGGTAIIASQVVRKYSSKKAYVCYDTFGGFVDEQFSLDSPRGTPSNLRTHYSSNSELLVRKILRLHGCQDVQLVRGDATKLEDGQLKEKYSVILIDVDLSEPVYLTLKKFYPKLSKGGIILVDDCDEDNVVWKAREGYSRFCHEMGFQEKIKVGLGIIEA
jgi:O-methyltransferase